MKIGALGIDINGETSAVSDRGYIYSPNSQKCESVVSRTKCKIILKEYGFNDVQIESLTTDKEGVLTNNTWPYICTRLIYSYQIYRQGGFSNKQLFEIATGENPGYALASAYVDLATKGASSSTTAVASPSTTAVASPSTTAVASPSTTAVASPSTTAVASSSSSPSSTTFQTSGGIGKARRAREKQGKKEKRDKHSDAPSKSLALFIEFPPQSTQFDEPPQQQARVALPSQDQGDVDPAWLDELINGF